MKFGLPYFGRAKAATRKEHKDQLQYPHWSTKNIPALGLHASNPTLELRSQRCSISRDPTCLQIGTEGMGGWKDRPDHDQDQWPFKPVLKPSTNFPSLQQTTIVLQVSHDRPVLGRLLSQHAGGNFQWTTDLQYPLQPQVSGHCRERCDRCEG